ncbi:GAF domain-containing protein [Sphingomonas sp. ASY06-1R]|uniref:GAF domain-containing protein n=1 Tax=Sphingomonas sp. ASY06-1R TaxID=3445771 RepID=UPI003FA21CBC
MPNKDILTTADTAKLLGVSIRTAQLLIEGGSVPSWKTPGGHRRVYRSDIQALIDGRSGEARAPSATVIVVAPTEQLEAYRRLFSDVPECGIQTFDDLHAALFAIASLRPHAVLIDVRDGASDRSEFLRKLATNPALGHSRILAIGLEEKAARENAERLDLFATPEEAIAAIRTSLGDAGEPVAALAEAAFPIALNEGQRLVALERAGLLDTAPEEAFDRLTWLAAEALKAPVSLIAMLTPSRQWFKSRVGLSLSETPRSWAFCNYTIMQKDVFVVEDLASDARFAQNPAVAGEPGFRFYAGSPILDGEGFPVGSLCVLDYESRSLSPREEQILSSLAALGSAEVRLRKTEQELRDAVRKSR